MNAAEQHAHLTQEVDWTVLCFAITAVLLAHPESAVAKSKLSYLKGGSAASLRLGQTTQAGKAMKIGTVFHTGADVSVLDFFNAVQRHGGAAAVGLENSRYMCSPRVAVLAFGACLICIGQAFSVLGDLQLHVPACMAQAPVSSDGTDTAGVREGQR